MASKKARTKPARGRPTSTSALSQAVVDEASYLTTLSSFSPKGNLFAFLSLAVDKHRLRIYNTISGQSTGEHVVDSARVTALTWSIFQPSEGGMSSLDDADSPPNNNKRKKRNSQLAEEPSQNKGIEVVVLGLSDGTLLFFSPTHGRTLRTLSHPTSTAAILSAVLSERGDKPNNIWTSGADGAIRLWDSRKNTLLGSWKNDDRIPYSSMAVRPGPVGVPLEMLVANHGIQLLSTSSSDASEGVFDPQKYKQLACFTGHASSIKYLQWDASQKPTSNRFLSIAEGDRFVYIWEVPDILQRSSSLPEGKIVASIPLDSDARSISLSISSFTSLSTPPTSITEKQTLVTLAASGKISVFPIPIELIPLASSNRTQHKVPTLLARSNLSMSRKGLPSSTQVVGASFVPGEEGYLRVARVVAGVRPVFDLVQYLDDSGDFIQNMIIDDVKAELINESQLAAPNKRYVESSSVAVRSGAEPGQHQDMDVLALRTVDGDLDVDLAELSLGQRLTALSGVDVQPMSDDSDVEAIPSTKQPNRSLNNKTQNEISVIPANSLTRTLIQALHSSDSRLLETCLAHSNPSLIRNTVRRLPPQLAVSLITACTERLGRGARAGNMKGGGGGASSQRGSTLIVWVKTVLAVHSGHLMSMPDLVARLSGLHAVLTTRLALQESLLSLSGRLDMVLSQIEMRSSTAPAPLVAQKEKDRSSTQANAAGRYIEGESEDEDMEEDEQMEVEIEIDSDEDGGSVEDVELGGDEEEEDSSEEEDDDDDSEEGGPTMNGFIDDEVEEYSDEEEDSE